MTTFQKTTYASCLLFAFFTYELGAQQSDSPRSVTSQQKNVTPKRRIAKFPGTSVWTDAQRASQEFPGFKLIGEYEKGGRGAQVTAADGEFYFSFYGGGLPGDGWDAGTIEHEWHKLDAAANRLIGWKKVDRSSKATGKNPPEHAIVLFDGSSSEYWANGKIKNRYLKAGARTKRDYKDFRLYLEFMVPFKPDPPISHPHRGNSGVFAVGAYEIQIADTFGLDLDRDAWKRHLPLKPANTWCGSIYGIQPPKFNMCLPPLTWQSLEIDFKAARFEKEQKVSHAVVSVIHNGVKVHDQVQLVRGTGGGPSGPRAEVAEGPIILQNHNNPNLFRNIWIVTAEQK